MTREILFRAKQMLCREWCEGCLVKDKTGCHIIDPNANIFRSDAEVYHVDENTVCQYTGLTDENGTKIFENDIVQSADSIGKIAWEYGAFIVDWQEEALSYPYMRKDLRKDLQFWRDKIEVIGNIFDNQTAEDGHETLQEALRKSNEPI